MLRKIVSTHCSDEHCLSIFHHLSVRWQTWRAASSAYYLEASGPQAGTCIVYSCLTAGVPAWLLVPPIYVRKATFRSPKLGGPGHLGLDGSAYDFERPSFWPQTLFSQALIIISECIAITENLYKNQSFFSIFFDAARFIASAITDACDPMNYFEARYWPRPATRWSSSLELHDLSSSPCQQGRVAKKNEK